VSADELRAVMRRFPTGVAEVTVDVNGQQLGLTVSVLVSLSLEPPLVGVAIRRDAALHELLREASAFGVSILADGQEALARHFARGVPPIALWQGVEREPGPLTGAPLLAGAAGWLEARLTAEHAVGDHTLFVGELLAAASSVTAGPLVHIDGGFRPL